jgi:hypothetical protein
MRRLYPSAHSAHRVRGLSLASHPDTRRGRRRDSPLRAPAYRSDASTPIACDTTRHTGGTLEGKNMKIISRKLASLAGIVLMATALGCASTSKTEGTGEYVDDTVITTKVKTAIFNEPTLKSAEINVETFKGTVQLSGFVASRGDVDKAVTVARAVPGVTAVKNDMRIK